MATIVRDVNGLYSTVIPNGRGIVAAYVLPDVTPPELTSWTLDMDSGQIIASFSETVDITSFQPQLVSLQNFFVEFATVTIEFDSFVRLEPGDASSQFTIHLSQTDLDTIKENRDIGSIDRNSFLNMSAGAITDMNNNNLIPTHIWATNFIYDSTSPSLLLFSLNTYTGLLTLTFDEIIDVTDLDPRGVTFVSQESSPSARYTLTGGSVSYFNRNIIHLLISDADLTALNSIHNLATSRSTTFIIASSRTVEDTSDNDFNPITVDSALQVLYFVDSPLAISFEYPRYYFSEGQTIMLRVTLNSTAATDVTFNVATESDQATGMSMHFL